MKAENLSVDLGERRVLRDVGQEFEPGTLTAVLGANGAGKSTLLRTLAGLIPPAQGCVLVGGRDLREQSRREIARQVAYLPQAATIDFPFPVEEVVLMGRYVHLSRFEPEGEKDRAAIEAALTAVDAASLRGRSVNELSGGEHQRILLARTLVTEAPVLLLDEPAANLDIRHALDLLQVLKREAEKGRTIVLAIHDLDLAYRFCGRFVLLHDGGVLASGGSEVLTSGHLRKAFGVAARRSGDHLVVE